ncbi:S8 family serine peptidase [Natronobeatus ordinarius]|uniref:S8 family serine peptidase n=1 Tax=Natronobeatus ordinarius TaxID=2963433 RepID=UPI0020CF675D|nr:S8 family serine peptidase [Natronobeatus ordinarius]
MVPLAAGDPGSVGNLALEDRDASDASLEEQHRAAVIDPQLEKLASTEDELTVVLRLTELRDVDEPRLQAATTRSDLDVRDELKSHAATTQSPVVATLERRPGVEVRTDFWITNALVVTVDTTETDLESLAALPHVERIHENYEVEAVSTAASSPAVDQGALETGSLQSTVAETAESDYTYGLEQINAPDVWDEFDNRGEGATVAVLDTGVDVDSHPDLELIEDGWAEFDEGGNLVDSEPYDPEGHGTHVTGTVGGDQTDANVHYGVAPDVGLAHSKVLDENGEGSFPAILAGMQWATDHEADVDVLTMSLGADDYIDEFIDPVENARDAGIVVVAAAGNEGQGTSSSPANVYDAFAVGGSDSNENLYASSSGEVITTADVWDNPPTHWPSEYTVPNVAAPGVNVLSAVPDDGHGYKSGTSMATPHVAGAAALLVTEDPDLSVSEIEQLLEETASHPDGGDQDSEFGHGIIDAHAAVSAAAGIDASLEVSDLEAPATVGDGEELTVSATVTNAGESTATRDVEVRLDDALLHSESVTLEADSDTDVAFENVLIDVGPGDYQLGVHVEDGGEATTELTVEATAATYTDEDGTVQTGGLRDAIDDWRSGIIDTGLLRDVIDYWRSGAEV